MNPTSDPYFGENFFSFFALFFSRLFSFFSGKLPLNALSLDEIQFFTFAFVGLMGALIGTFLILKKMTMLANALSHTTLLGIVLAYFIMSHFFVHESDFTFSLALLFPIAVVTALLTTFLTQFLHRFAYLQEEAATGLVFTTLFALGIFLLSLFAKNLHLGAELIVGSADALKIEDLILIFRTFLVISAVILLFYKEMKMVSFDPLLAAVSKVKPAFYSYLLMFLTSFALISTFRAVGVLMGLAYFVGPSLIARRFTSRLGPLLALSALIASTASLIGIALSRHILTMSSLSISTAGLIVSLLFFSYILAISFQKKSYSV